MDIFSFFVFGGISSRIPRKTLEDSIDKSNSFYKSQCKELKELISSLKSEKTSAKSLLLSTNPRK
jgi:hypothetical protein